MFNVIPVSSSTTIEFPLAFSFHVPLATSVIVITPGAITDTALFTVAFGAFTVRLPIIVPELIFNVPVVALLTFTFPVSICPFKSMLTNLLRLIPPVIGAVNLIVSPLLASRIATVNEIESLTLNVFTLFSSYTIFKWLSIRAYTVQAAFTAYGVPSVVFY